MCNIVIVFRLLPFCCCVHPLIDHITHTHTHIHFYTNKPNFYLFMFFFIIPKTHSTLMRHSVGLIAGKKNKKKIKTMLK